MLVTEPDLDRPVRPGGGEGVCGEDAVGADPAGGAGEAGRQAERGAEGAPALPGPHQPCPAHHQTKLCNSVTKRAECLRLSGPPLSNCILHWQSGTFLENSARMRTTAEHVCGQPPYLRLPITFLVKEKVCQKQFWYGGGLDGQITPKRLPFTH